MSVVFNSEGIAAEFYTGGPTGDTDGVGGGLTTNVKVKPSWICSFENFQVSSENCSHRHHSSPTNSVQNSMSLKN
ncbi:hypothetical protein IC582_000556 [Cucumis melo]